MAPSGGSPSSVTPTTNGTRSFVPGKVVVTEYADIAAAFLDKDETGMVNAVLDQLAAAGNGRARVALGIAHQLDAYLSANQLGTQARVRRRYSEIAA